MEAPVDLGATIVLGPDRDPVHVRTERRDADLAVLGRPGRAGIADRGVVAAAAHIGVEDHLVAAGTGPCGGADVPSPHELAAPVHDRESGAPVGQESAGYRAERRLLD